MPNNQILKDFYTYQINFSALSASTSQTGSIQIQADSSFVLQKLTYAANIAAAAQTDSSRVIPLVTILLTDTGSSQQLMSAAVPITGMFGTGEIPFILPRPRLFRARASITVAVSNFSASTTYNLYLSFLGERVFVLNG